MIMMFLIYCNSLLRYHCVAVNTSQPYKVECCCHLALHKSIDLHKIKKECKCIDLQRYIERKISNNKTKPNETKQSSVAIKRNETHLTVGILQKKIKLKNKTNKNKTKKKS